MEWLIENGLIVTPYKIIKQGAIVIEDSKIVDIGKTDDLKEKYRRYSKIDASKKAVLPGLINTHTHISMSLLRGVADDMPLLEWLNNKIWPIEAKLIPDDIYVGALLSIIEMLKSGTTVFNDMYFEMDQVAKAVEETGIRGVLSRGLIGLGPEETEKKAFKEGLEFALKYNNAADGRIKTMLGPHAPYTCSPSYLGTVIEAAKEHNLPLHIHIAENKNEIKLVEETFKVKREEKGIIEYLDKIGLFDVPVVSAHTIWVRDEELDILHRKNVGIAHNPVSNMKIANGVAPIPKMLSHDIMVGIGTDGPASNNSLDMFREMKIAALLHKSHLSDPTVVPALEVLKMGTIYGAKVLRIDKEVGSLEVGKKADVIMVNLNNAHLTPLHNIVSLIIYAAMGSDVDFVMVDGQVLLENGKLTKIDEQKIYEKAQKNAEELLSRAQS